MTAAKSAVPPKLKIPDVGGLSLKQAALTYAQAGWCIVPTRVGDLKNPGSLVGAGWQNQATNDPEQIEKWWSEYPRIGGIAFHPGPSGAVVFDYDKTMVSMPDNVREALETGKFQQSRENGVRGHRFFACAPGEFGGSAGAFMRWGEVRSQGGVIMLAPSAHPEDDGLYLWHDSGELPPLPDLLRDMLSAPGETAEPKTSDELRAFLAKYTENNAQHGLQGPLTKFHADVKTGASRHEAMRDALPWAFRESIIGRFSAEFAYDSLKLAFFRVKPEAMPTGEFDRLAQWAAAVAELADPDEIRAKVDRPKDQSDVTPEPIFREFGPAEWAKDVEPTRFLIKRVLSTDTWGVNSGPKKSLKTHDNQAIGLAVATGTNLYNDARFAVQRPGKVLYIVGEGGDNQIRRTLHRMLAAYGINREDVARDSNFPFVVEFGSAPLDSAKLRDELNRLLDKHQPSLVLTESFYNFHPAGVTASNLYERGQVIDGYHKLVRAGGSDVASLLTDHHKKSASGTDLDQISMSGQAENADSWIIRDHRKAPDVHTGDFYLETSFNSRDWGGNTFHIDWHLGPFDHDTAAHTGFISWDVTEKPSANAPLKNSITKSQRKDLDVVAAISNVLFQAHDNGVGSLNQSELVDKVKALVPDAGKDFIIKKLDIGEQEGALIAQPGARNAKFYILPTHPMYSHD